jgi:hypothetical protein
MPNEQTSVPLFTSGEVLTAANMNLSAGTGVPVFTNTTTRDAAFGGAGEKVLAEGQLCYLSSTNVTQYYDGAAWQPVGATAGLTLVKAQTVGTTVGSVAVTDAFSATYDNYKITYTGGLGSTSGGITMILGATVTGYYSSIIFGSSYGASGPTYAGSANTANWTFMGIASTASASVNAEINCPFLTVNTLMSHSRSDAATAGTAGTGQGYLANSTSYTGFTLTPASGTLTGGTIRVYGYANS